MQFLQQLHKTFLSKSFLFEHAEGSFDKPGEKQHLLKVRIFPIGVRKNKKSYFFPENKSLKRSISEN